MNNIGLDLDGVLYNWHIAVYDYFVLNKNYTGTLNDFWTTEYKSLSDDDWNYLTTVDIFYSSQFPTEECKVFLSELQKKFEIFYITNRPISVRTTTEQFLKKHCFPFQENLLFTDDKETTARRYMLGICVEDQPHNLTKLQTVADVIMIAQPYNIDYWDKFPTAHSLISALKLIKKI
jgi:uncharacterized HAD superfamily protein